MHLAQLEHKKSPDQFVADVVARSYKKAADALLCPETPFREFLKAAWTIIEPANPLQSEWYVDYLCEYLELVTAGEIRKLLINLPPREGKSNIVTVCWPAWSWTRKAFLRFITCSYSSALSVKHAVMRRIIIESNWYQGQWGGMVHLASDQNQKQEFENTARGHMIATSVGGTITGKGGDVIIEDDMINPLQAVSDADRTQAINMHKMVLSTRLDNPKSGSRVIVEQRTHDQDVSGYVMANEKGWVHLNLPLIAKRKTIIILPTSKVQIIREPDDILSPIRHGRAEVEDLRLTMTPQNFEAQCQQEPSSDLGNIIKRTYWEKSFYTVLPSGFDLVLTSWDMTFKETKSGSYVVGQAWGQRGANFYLFPMMIRARMDFTESLASFKNFIVLVPQVTGFVPNGHLVEDKANGPAVISALQNNITGICPVKPIGSKAARAQAVTPLIQAGNVHLPDKSIAPWVTEFVEECAKFRGEDSEINDQVDAMTQALNYLNNLPYKLVEDADNEEPTSFVDLEGASALGGFGD